MAKSKKRKPSFDAPDDAGTAAAVPWVYRSDTGDSATKTATATKRARRATATPRPTATAPTAASASAGPVETSRAAAAQALVDRYAKAAGAVGLLPIPILDLLSIIGMQVAMLHALTKHYGIPFSQERGKAIIASLLGGMMPTIAGYQIAKVVGPLLGILTVSGFAVAATSAVGALFITHFEAGGTLLDLDVEGSRRQLKTALTKR